MAREQFQTLTEPMYYILLSVTKECCGVEIMGRVTELSHERLNVGPGTLYALLPKLEKAGFITETRREGRQRWYKLTDKGLDTLKEEYRRLEIMLEDGAEILSG